MSPGERDPEREARRAKRLAERAAQRAARKVQQARRAEERAARLADRASEARERRVERPIDESIEDLVEEVTGRISDKAEEWIDSRAESLFEAGTSSNRRVKRAAERARRDADRAKRAVEEASVYAAVKHADELDVDDDQAGPETGRSSRGRRRRRDRNWSWAYDLEAEFFGRRGGRRGRRRFHGQLYRDSRGAKICGVCAGMADYLGMERWQVRLVALIGLGVIGQVVLPAYFIAYFLLDEKPKYREVTDKFREVVADDGHAEAVRRQRQASRGGWSKSGQKDRRPRTPSVSNGQSLRIANDKFADIEERLRSMESHVTSSRFELQRELRKISGEDA